MGNIATGLLAGINAARYLKSNPVLELPVTTMTGALCRYITSADLNDFQPMKANYGILPAFERRPQGRKERNQLYLERAIKDLRSYTTQMNFPLQCDS